MNKSRKRVQPGDVVELTGPEGHVYVLCLGEHPDYGTGVLVWPVLHEDHVMAFQRRDFVEEGYFTFHPVNASIRQGLASIVGELVPPTMPTTFRRIGAMSGRDILTWVIEEPRGERVARQLTDTEAKLPIAAVWTHRFVFEMVLQGWRPEHAGRGMRDASSAPPPVVSRPAPEAIRVANVVDHYLYLPRKQDAATVAVVLRAKGFKTEETRAADDNAWLVRAAHEIIPSEEILDGVRTMMEALVAPFDGEYDGWEASN